MKTKKLGPTEIEISAIGLGGMLLSIRGRPSEEQAIAVIHRALDLGVTLIDTADSYCLDESDKHHNERLIRKALDCKIPPSPPFSKGGAQGKPPPLVKGDRGGFEVGVATKGGLMRPGGDWITNGDPAHLRKTIAESALALGRPIDLWQFHAPDPSFKIEDSLRPVAEAQKEGLIRYVGVSNFDVEEIKRAQAVVPVVSVQNRYNLWDRSPESDGVLEYCEEERLTFFPWSPLGGMGQAPTLGDIPELKALARERSVSPQRLVLAWMRTKSSCIVPIPGVRRIETLEDSIAAVDLKLSVEEIRRIDQIRLI